MTGTERSWQADIFLVYRSGFRITHPFFVLEQHFCLCMRRLAVGPGAEACTYRWRLPVVLERSDRRVHHLRSGAECGLNSRGKVECPGDLIWAFVLVTCKPTRGLGGKEASLKSAFTAAEQHHCALEKLPGSMHI